MLARRIAFGRKVRGLHKVVERDRFDAAVAEFERTHGADLDLACRNLFLDLLWPIAEEAGKPGLIEMSCFTVAESPTLVRLFPEAKILHTVRDGRDAGSSKVSKRQKRSHPRDGSEGLRWWEGRLRKIEAGVRELPPGEAAHGQPRRARRRRPRGRLRAAPRLPRARRRAGHAPVLRRGDERLRRPQGALAGGPQPRTSRTHSSREYERTLERLEREGFHCAPQLRRAYEARQPA